MKPGRELDALVAKEVMGLEVVRNPKGGWSIGMPDYYDDAGLTTLSNPLPDYSNSIEAAWNVVERLQYPVAHFELSSTRDQAPGGVYYTASFFLLGKKGSWIDGKSTNAPHAICLAALRAIGFNFEKS